MGNTASMWTKWLHTDWKKSSRWSYTTHTGNPSLHLFPRKQAMCLHREAHYPLWIKRCLQSSSILKLLPLLLQISGSQGKHLFLSPLADFEYLPNFLFFFYDVVPKLPHPEAFQMMHSGTYCLWWLFLLSTLLDYRILRKHRKHGSGQGCFLKQLYYECSDMMTVLITWWVHQKYIYCFIIFKI